MTAAYILIVVKLKDTAPFIPYVCSGPAHLPKHVAIPIDTTTAYKRAPIGEGIVPAPASLHHKRTGLLCLVLEADRGDIILPGGEHRPNIDPAELERAARAVAAELLTGGFGPLYAGQRIHDDRLRGLAVSVNVISANSFVGPLRPRPPEAVSLAKGVLPVVTARHITSAREEQIIAAVQLLDPKATIIRGAFGLTIPFGALDRLLAALPSDAVNAAHS